MARPPSAQVRSALIRHAAQLLARREPVTLRSVVAGTGASTMAVYTHFGDMAGLWRAVRQEGFALLADRLAAVPQTDDPLHDVGALGAGYAQHGLNHPELYRVMFDGAADLEDPAGADATLELLVGACERARAAGLLAVGCEPAQVALRIWTSGHGLLMLVVTGVLGTDVLHAEAPAVATAILAAAGASADAAASSVRAGWHAQLDRAHGPA